MYQLFVRQFGTNNLPDCSNMCHESTSFALAESIGLGKASIRLEDLEDTDLIIIIGQNPGTCAPRMMSSLADGKAKRRENYRRQSSARSRFDEFRQSESAALFQSFEISAGDARSDLDEICRSVSADPNRRRYGVFKRRYESSAGKRTRQARIRFSITNLSTKKLPVLRNLSPIWKQFRGKTFWNKADFRVNRSPKPPKCMPAQTASSPAGRWA